MNGWQADWCPNMTSPNQTKGQNTFICKYKYKYRQTDAQIWPALNRKLTLNKGLGKGQNTLYMQIQIKIQTWADLIRQAFFVCYQSEVLYLRFLFEDMGTSLAGVGFCPNTELQIFSPPAVADHLPFQDLQETAFREEVASLLWLPTTAFILIHSFFCVELLI